LTTINSDIQTLVENNALQESEIPQFIANKTTEALSTLPIINNTSNSELPLDLMYLIQNVKSDNILSAEIKDRIKS
jgi:hypothetical protein